jgi:hypothetical protein
MSRSITLQNIEGAVLVDAVAVVLCDPTSAYGIKLHEAGTVIFAANTSVPRVSLGTYSFDISSLDTSLVHDAYWKIIRTNGDIDYIPQTINVVTDVPPSTEGKAYASIAEGNTYFTERFNSDAWEDATDANKAKALITATRLIDRLNFMGEKTSSSQTLQFPRNDDSTIPTDIKYATLELAHALLDGVDPELEFENLSMVAQTYSNARATYDRSSKPEHVLSGIPSIKAWYYLKPYLRDPFSFDLSRVS